MTAEATYSIGLKYQKSGIELTIPSNAIAVDVAGDSVQSGIIDLTTSYEYIPLGDVILGGLCYLENVGSDNICIREDLTGSPRLVLYPGEAQLVRLDRVGFATPAAKAATSTSRLKYFLIDA